MTRFQVIYQDGSYSIYGTKIFNSFPSFCQKFFDGVCQFPYEIEQIRRLRAGNTLSGDIIDFDVLTGEKKAIKYTYGMRARGFSPGCQPMGGLIERRDGVSDDFYDILTYSRLLTQKELKDYELTLIGWSEEQ